MPSIESRSLRSGLVSRCLEGRFCKRFRDDIAAEDHRKAHVDIATQAYEYAVAAWLVVAAIAAAPSVSNETSENRMLPSRLAAALLTATLVSTASLNAVAAQGAASEDAEAKALFEAGREAFDAGKYETALVRWKEAHTLSRRPALLYNIGLAHDRLRQDAAAIEAFEAFVSALPDDPRTPDARARIEAMQAAKVLSPAQVASASHPSDSDAATSSPFRTNGPVESADETPWYDSWILWTGIGGAVVASVLVVALASSGHENTIERAEPTSGVTVEALRR